MLLFISLQWILLTTVSPIVANPVVQSSLPKNESLQNVFKDVLARSLLLTGCNLDHYLQVLVAKTIYNELTEVAVQNGIDTSELEKLNIGSLRSSSHLYYELNYGKNYGKSEVRYTNLYKDYTNVNIAEQVVANSASNLESFIDRDSNFNFKVLNYRHHNVWKRQISTQIREKFKHSKMNSLISQGLLRYPLYLSKDKFSSEKGEDFEVSDSAEILYANPIKIQFYAFNPTKVTMNKSAGYLIKYFNFVWKLKGKTLTTAFTYFVPNKVDGKFEAELEFDVKLIFRAQAWANIFTLGISALISGDTQTKTGYSNKFNVEITASPDWFVPKGKVIIKILTKDAEECFDD